jgi:signal transduction histidine kinase
MQSLFLQKLISNVLIDNIIEKERNQALPPNFSIEYDVNPSVKLISDRELVGVILENLIDNAIKFYNTSDRISPFVKIMIRKSGPKQISIQVDDNGIGVNTGDKDHIFHLFVRASERSETGGIGLYLSKLSTQRLGGEITCCEIPPIKGQRFLFSFRLILHQFSKRGAS